MIDINKKNIIFVKSYKNKNKYITVKKINIKYIDMDEDELINLEYRFKTHRQELINYN